MICFMSSIEEFTMEIKNLGISVKETVTLKQKQKRDRKFSAVKFSPLDLFLLWKQNHSCKSRQRYSTSGTPTPCLWMWEQKGHSDLLITFL